MVRWLVLGDGGVARTVLGTLVTWPGDCVAVVADEGLATALRDGAADVRVGDPADRTTYPSEAEVVLVTVPSGSARRVAASARAAFPAARLVVHLDADADREVREAVGEVADDVVDATDRLAGAVLDVATGDDGTRLQGLRRVLRTVPAPLAVVAHDNPDPDAIGSALALVRLAAAVGLDAQACYFGDISHQENRALVNLLDLDLRRLDDVTVAEEFGSVALVDHARPGVNDGLPPETRVDVVLDHHPPRAPVEARFVDLRTEAGATSTVLASYLSGYGIVPDRTVATALLYGIRVDTRDFTREVSIADYEAAASLIEHVDTDVLSQVESPSITAEVFETLARAIRNREVRGDTVVSGVGRINDRDALAQAAERLVGMAGIHIALVHGIMDGTVYVSARGRQSEIDLGETLRDAFGPIGSAGGHADMAGAQIPLGILAEVDDDSTDSLADAVDDLLGRRFFETLEAAPVRPPDPATSGFPFDDPDGDG
ncbi:MAG: bifunctional oligoribonuclease/PAP phosphatase NrnA [Haloferacaceae archaeon]